MSLAIRPRSQPRVVTTFGRRAPSADTALEAAPGGAPTKPPIVAETQLERLVKLVPADVVALYIPAIGLGALTAWPYYGLAVTIAATALVPVLLYLDARPGNERVPPVQYIVRTLAFIAWACVISQPFTPYHINPVVPALIALVLPVLGERLLR